jgi:hypothetical protein
LSSTACLSWSFSGKCRKNGPLGDLLDRGTQQAFILKGDAGRDDIAPRQLRALPPAVGGFSEG